MCDTRKPLKAPSSVIGYLIGGCRAFASLLRCWRTARSFVSSNYLSVLVGPIRSRGTYRTWMEVEKALRKRYCGSNVICCFPDGSCVVVIRRHQHQHLYQGRCQHHKRNNNSNYHYSYATAAIVCCRHDDDVIFLFRQGGEGANGMEVEGAVGGDAIVLHEDKK